MELSHTLTAVVMSEVDSPQLARLEAAASPSFSGTRSHSSDTSSGPSRSHAPRHGAGASAAY